MTDFASLFVADRGQKARLDPSRRQGQLRRLGQEAAGRGPRLARGAPLRRQDRRMPSRSCRAAASSRSSSAVKNAGGAVALVPRRARREPARRAPTSSPSGDPGAAALGWLLAQHRFDAYRSKKEDAERGPRVLLTGEPARIDETVRLGRSDRAGPRPRQHARRRPRPGRDRAGRPRGGQAARRRSPGHVGKELADGYPLIAAVGARRDGRARAAADRARMGQARRPARRHRRQGRMLRQRRARPQAGGADADDEEGHGRGGPCAGTGAAGHRREAAGPASPAHPCGRECRVGQRLPARRHRQVAQRRFRRNRQHRCGRTADPCRRARQGRARTSPS